MRRKNKKSRAICGYCSKRSIKCYNLRVVNSDEEGDFYEYKNGKKVYILLNKKTFFGTHICLSQIRNNEKLNPKIVLPQPIFPPKNQKGGGHQEPHLFNLYIQIFL